MYAFDGKRIEGEKHEKDLDRYYSKWFKIEPVSLFINKLGIDRIYTSLSDGTKWTVEYKADTTASKTGNAFVETISVSTTNKPGWAYSSCAQLLFYYLPIDRKVIRVTMANIKNLVKKWKEKYQERRIPNNGYETIGTLVPLDIFASYGVTDKLSENGNG